MAALKEDPFGCGLWNVYALRNYLFEEEMSVVQFDPGDGDFDVISEETALCLDYTYSRLG